MACAGYQVTALSGFHSATFVNRLSGLGFDVNTDSLFVVDTSNTYDEIVIPEDGIYSVVFDTDVQAINTTAFSSARLQFRSIIQWASPGLTTVTVGSQGYAQARGGFGSTVAYAQASAEAIETFKKGDKVFVEYQTLRDSTNTTATIHTEVFIIKLQVGPKGAKGDTGAAGSGLPDLGDAGQILTVNDAETDYAWEDPPAFSVVAYGESMTQMTDWYNSSFENLYTGFDGTDLNEGGFTSQNDDDSRQRIVVPEDGVYQVHASYFVNVGNTGSSARFRPRCRVRADVSGTIVTVGEDAITYSRGEYHDALGDVALAATGLVALSSGDTVWGEIQAYRQNSATTADVDGSISVFKVGGPTGPAGEGGADGADGTDTHPNIAFPGLPSLQDIFDEATQDVRFYVYRDDAALTLVAASATLTATDFKVVQTDGSGLTNTLNYDVTTKEMHLTSISLDHSVVSDGGIASTVFVFELLGEDGNSFFIRKQLAFRRVDTDTFGGSADYPDFSGNADKVLAVNSDEDDVEWVDQSAGVSTFTGLSDTPSSLGTTGQVVAINTAADAFVFGDIAVNLTVSQSGDELVITATASVE